MRREFFVIDQAAVNECIGRVNAGHLGHAVPHRSRADTAQPSESRRGALKALLFIAGVSRSHSKR